MATHGSSNLSTELADLEGIIRLLPLVIILIILSLSLRLHRSPNQVAMDSSNGRNIMHGDTFLTRYPGDQFNPSTYHFVDAMHFSSRSSLCDLRRYQGAGNRDCENCDYTVRSEEIPERGWHDQCADSARAPESCNQGSLLSRLDRRFDLFASTGVQDCVRNTYFCRFSCDLVDALGVEDGSIGAGAVGLLDTLCNPLICPPGICSQDRESHVSRIPWSKLNPLQFCRIAWLLL